MAKSKKKKQKTADFSKVKLKVGKKKPSAANSTDISFKSSSINIVSQLEEKHEPTNRRNLSLKDILSQMSHYNQNTRQEASFSLKEFFVQYPALLHQNFSQIIAKLLEKSVDADHIVRRNFISCLRHVFSNVSEQQIFPFFSLVMAHLNCAMTHISEDTQIDSLQFLDVCLDCFPRLFIKDSKKILHSVFSLISHKQSAFTGKSNKGKKRDHKGISMIVNQSISVDPTGKISSLKTKRDALELLLKIASLVFMSNDCENGQLSDQPRMKNVHVSQSISYVVISKYCSQFQNAENIIDKKSKAQDSSENIVFSQEKTKELIISFLPVLLKCWNEANPACYSVSSGDIPNDSSFSTMSTIVKIIKLVISGSSANRTNLDSIISFADNYLEDFVKNFMNHFPYSAVIPPSNSKKSEKNFTETGLTSDVIALNINLCEIYSNFLEFDESKSKSQLGICKKILEYIQSLISGFESKEQSNHLQAIKKVFECLCDIFIGQSSNEESNLSDYICGTLQHLCNLYKYSKDCNIKLHLLSILENCLNLQEKCHAKDFIKIINSWNDTLPSDLQSTSSGKLIEKIIQMMTKHLIQHKASSEWSNSLVLAISHIMASQDGIMSKDSADLHMKLIQLVYFLPKIPKELAESFALICHREEISDTVKQKIAHVLFFCFKEKKTLDLSLFLSFAFSVVLGISSSQLQVLQRSQHSNENSKRPSCLKFLISEDCVDENGNTTKHEKQLKLVKLILDILQTLDCRAILLNVFKPSLSKLLVEFDVFPARTALGILLLFKRMLAWTETFENDEKFFKRLGELMFSIIISTCVKLSPAKATGTIFNKRCFFVITEILDESEKLFEEFLEAMNSALISGELETDVIQRGIHFIIREPLQRKFNDMTSEERFSQLRKVKNTVSNSRYIFEPLLY